MTNDELKKKIVKVLKETINWTTDYSIPIGIVYKSELDKIADALIAAGIRDMSDIRSLADNVILSVIVHKAEVSSMEQRAKEAEHRAEVAERALRKSISFLTCRGCQAFLYGPCDTDACGDERCINNFLKQAEKEIAEEKGK